MHDKLEKLIEEKSIRCAFGVSPFVAGLKYISEKDLREFFKDKVIIDKKEKVWPQAEIAYKKWRGLE